MLLGLALSPCAGSLGNVPALDLSFLGEAVDPRITFSRPSTAMRVNAQGLLEVVASGAPRIDYDPVTLAVRGLLVEEQRSNLLWNSSNFSAWGKFGATVTDNQAIALDGTMTADKLTATLADGGVFQGATMVGGQAYTGSVWLRADVPCQLSIFLTETAGGSGNTSAVCNVTTAWQRFTVTRTPGVGVTGLSFQIGGGNTFSTGEEVCAWGGQMEQGAFATSYIPTGAAQATRAADLASMLLGSLLQSNGGTLIVDAAVIGASASAEIVGVQDASGVTAYAKVRQNAGGTSVLGQVGSSAGLSSGLAVTSYAAGTPFKFALRFRGGQIAASCNGGAVATSATPATLDAMDRLVFGPSCMYARRVRLYGPNVTDSQLQALTA